MLQPLSVPAGRRRRRPSRTRLGRRLRSQGAVSQDGSRAFWSKGGVPPYAGLYLRDTARNETIRLDEVREGAFGTGKVEPLFQAANTDGTRRLLHRHPEPDRRRQRRRRRPLSLEGGGERGLRRSGRLPGRPDRRGGGLRRKRRSAGPAAGRGRRRLERLPGRARGAATPKGRRTSGAAKCAASPGQPNLYLWREGVGMRFVARLAGEDERDWGGLPASSRPSLPSAPPPPPPRAATSPSCRPSP